MKHTILPIIAVVVCSNKKKQNLSTLPLSLLILTAGNSLIISSSLLKIKLCSFNKNSCKYILWGSISATTAKTCLAFTPISFSDHLLKYFSSFKK